MINNEQDASYLKALGHPTRLMIVKELMKGHMNVSEIEGRLDIRQANTSQHLNILRINGIVESERKGTLKYYYLREPNKMKRLINTIEIDYDKL